MKLFRLFSILMIAIMFVVAIRPWGVQSAGADIESAASDPDQKTLPVDQLIIKYKQSDSLDRAAPLQANQIDRLSAAAGMELTYFRPMSGEAHVLKLPEAMPESEAMMVAAKLAALPDVEYAEPDAIMLPMATVPDDPEYTNQWHYFAPGANHYGINAPAAWDVITGTASIWVAVLDTGITDHPDLVGRWSGGYDFITDPDMGNDTDGRDSDPHDPGDWVAANECGYTHDASDSSWHGTHVAGTIGAATNNATGVAGINWNSMILPVRVLGKCGGYTSDIADGMRWAAGLTVSGVTTNPNQAKVLNLSLGGPGSCSTTYQQAIDAVLAAGSTIVISAGNSNADSSGFRPGNCNGVITVAATDRDGDRAYYSNYGSVVEISGPGGAQSFINDPNGVLSTLNSGTTIPSTANYEYYQGTSMAAPHVAGVASLLLSQNPNLSPQKVTQVLQATVTQFPSGSTCTTSICGTGIVNAFGAVSPAITSISPSQVLKGAGPLSLTVNGANFNASAKVNFNGSQRSTTFVSSTQLQATLTYTDTLTPGSYPITVVGTYGTVGTLTSNAVNFSVEGEMEVYLPLMIKPAPAAPPSGWTTIEQQDFEGSFPGSWQVSDEWPGTGEFFWAKRNCRPHAGANSGWAVGGGAQGSSLSCGSNYPNDADAWMVYGPFDLSDATAADLSFWLWLNTEIYIDDVCRYASVDGSSFAGYCTSGNTGGWEQKTLDLASVPGLGNLLGQSQVWVALYFFSDDSVVQTEGGYVDDILLRKCTGTCSSAMVSSVNVGQEVDTPSSKQVK